MLLGLSSACDDSDPKTDALGPDGGEPDSGELGLDGGTDGGDDDDGPLPVPDWDASLPVSGPPLGYAYAEVPGSFKLVEPAALAKALGVLAADTMDVRLLYTAVQAGNAGAEVEYGSVFLEDAGVSYQYPNTVDTFRVAPSVGDPSTFVSLPFDYHLFAWVPQEGRTDVGYQLELASAQTVWAAKFSGDFSVSTREP